MNAMTQHCQDRPSWLAERRRRIQASDAAAILGRDPWRGPLAVYVDKTATEPPTDEFRWQFERGLALEGTIIRAVAGELSVAPVLPYTIRVDRRYPWLGATPDCMVIPSGVLQVKTWSWRDWRAWESGPPLHVQIQVQIEMQVCEVDQGWVAVSIGGEEPELFAVPRNERFLKAALPLLEEFRDRVLRRDPPEADALPASREAIRRMFPNDDGSETDLGEEFVAVDARLTDVKRVRAELATEQDALENQLRMAIGKHSVARLPNGVEYTYKLQTRREYTVKAGEYRVLRRGGAK